MKLYATNDWGIIVPQSEVGTFEKAEALSDAGFELIEPVQCINSCECLNSIYYDEAGEYVTPEEAFYFYPLQQPGLFGSFYGDMDCVLVEVYEQAPDIFTDDDDIRSRLVKINVICEAKEDA